MPLMIFLRPFFFLLLAAQQPVTLAAVLSISSLAGQSCPEPTFLAPEKTPAVKAEDATSVSTREDSDSDAASTPPRSRVREQAADRHLSSLWTQLTADDKFFADEKQTRAQDRQHFLDVAKTWLLQDDYPLEIRLIIGGTVDEPLVRLPSYLVAPIALFEGLHRLRELLLSGGVEGWGVRIAPPMLTCGSMHWLAMRYNSSVDGATGAMPPQQVEKMGALNMSTMDKFLRTQISSQLFENYVQTIHDDASFWENPLVHTVVERGASILERAENEQLASELRKMGFAHGGAEGERNALRYAASHSVDYGDFVFGGREKSGALLTVGGSPEAIFNRVRVLLQQHSGEIIAGLPGVSVRESIGRLISVSGHKCVYYKEDGYEGDLSLREAALFDGEEALLTRLSKSSKSGKADHTVLKNFLLKKVIRLAMGDESDPKKFVHLVVLAFVLRTDVGNAAPEMVETARGSLRESEVGSMVDALTLNPTLFGFDSRVGRYLSTGGTKKGGFAELTTNFVEPILKSKFLPTWENLYVGWTKSRALPGKDVDKILDLVKASLLVNAIKELGEDRV